MCMIFQSGIKAWELVSIIIQISSADSCLSSECRSTILSVWSCDRYYWYIIYTVFIAAHISTFLLHMSVSHRVDYRPFQDRHVVTMVWFLPHMPTKMNDTHPFSPTIVTAGIGFLLHPSISTHTELPESTEKNPSNLSSQRLHFKNI